MNDNVLFKLGDLGDLEYCYDSMIKSLKDKKTGIFTLFEFEEFLLYVERLIDVISKNKEESKSVFNFLNDYWCMCLYFDYKKIILYNMAILNFMREE